MGFLKNPIDIWHYKIRNLEAAPKLRKAGGGKKDDPTKHNPKTLNFIP